MRVAIGVYIRKFTPYLVIIITNIAINSALSLFSVWVSERYSFSVRRRLFEQVLRTKWQPISTYHSGDLMTRITSDVSSVTSGVIDVLTSVVSLIVQFIVAFLLLCHYEPQLSLFVLILGPIAAVASFFFGRKLKKIQVKLQETEAKYRSFMQENISNVLIVKSFTAEDRMLDELTVLFHERLKWLRKKNRMAVIMNAVIGSTFALAYLSALAWGVIKISLGLITYGTLTLFLQLVSQIQGPIIRLSHTIPTLISIFASAGRINEINTLEQEERGHESLNADNMSVSFENVAFAYDHDSIFNDVSLYINAGETIAVTGESGIGKTTLIRLIMDFFAPSSGNIHFEAEGQHFNASAKMRQYISYVPQGDTLFSGTIRKNILLGNINASDAEIRKVLETVSATEFVDALKDGIDTVIGEKGVGLSEGQAQRIAIARALIKKAPLIVFDEATSALDEATELRIIKRIRELPDSPTCILITHRREIIPYLDREIVIQDKKASGIETVI